MLPGDLCLPSGAVLTAVVPLEPGKAKHRDSFSIPVKFSLFGSQLGSCGDKNVTFAPWGNSSFLFLFAVKIRVLQKDVTSQLLWFDI